MNKKYIGIIIFLILFIFPIYKLSAQTTNAGFVQANIWYSKDPFEEGEKIQIYTLIFNPDLRELSGTVLFFDKTILLGKKNFTITAKAAKAISIDWTATIGDHKIFAKIENAKFLISAGKYEDVYLTENQTNESLRTVNKKIIPDPTAPKTTTTDGGQVQNIEKFIIEKTPDFISKPMVLGAETMEGFRSSIRGALENKKGKVQTEIKILSENKTPEDAKSKNNPVLKPFKYVELFIISFVSFILNNRFLFYGILIFVTFFLLRYLWRLIF